MSKRNEIPISPDVLKWAIECSGYQLDELADESHVDPSALAAWVDGLERPDIASLRKVANKLKRTVPTFFLPAPPTETAPPVAFRHPPNSEDRSLGVSERTCFREATRLQRAVSWALDDMGASPPTIPLQAVGDPLEEAATAIRGALGFDIDAQVDASSPADALQRWRTAAESAGMLVFTFNMGRDAARGFSVWDDRAPLIAINSSWAASARIFTMAHELGHLVTRTNSVCDEGVDYAREMHDEVERWCEAFAATLLLPESDVVAFLKERQYFPRPGEKIVKLRPGGGVANRFKVSLRAAVLRLIDLGLADWPLYRSIPPSRDAPKQSSGGGGGKTRLEARLDRYGKRPARVMFSAFDQEAMTASEVADYMDVGPGELAELRSEVTD